MKPKRELKFKSSDQVRKPRRTFKKGYLPSWTQEIFTVTKIIPRVPPVCIQCDSKKSLFNLDITGADPDRFIRFVQTCQIF